MKTTIKLPISKSDKLLVSEGDAVSPQTVILERRQNSISKILHVSQLLKVKEKVIYKYLKKKLSEEVNHGEIIVEKKGWWSTITLKSPISGKIKEVDLKTGTITITGLDSQAPMQMKIPVSGKVNRISAASIEIDITAVQISGEKGEGQEVIGNIVYFPGETIKIFDIDTDVEEKIVLLKKIADEIMVKLEVLGARGVVTIKPTAQMTLPYIKIDEDEFSRLIHFKGSKAWLRPVDKQIIIIE